MTMAVTSGKASPVHKAEVDVGVTVPHAQGSLLRVLLAIGHEAGRGRRPQAVRQEGALKL